MRSSRPAWSSAIAVASLAAVVFSTALLVALIFTKPGHRWLSRQVSSAIGKNLGGKLEIDHIDGIQLDRAVAHGVRFLSPDGVAAIEAPHVVLEFDLRRLMAGEWGWQRALIDKPVVRVIEGPNGKINMEEIFSPKSGSPKSKKDEAPLDRSQRVLDLRNMVTSGATLHIGGGSLPTLRLVGLDGIMRVEVHEGGEATLRFDQYRGSLVEGLPIGELEFRDVKGQVLTGSAHLLDFEGSGRNRGEPVDFALSIDSKPKNVHISASFEHPSAASLASRAMAAWSKIAPGIDIDVDAVD